MWRLKTLVAVANLLGYREWVAVIVEGDRNVTAPTVLFTAPPYEGLSLLALEREIDAWWTFLGRTLGYKVTRKSRYTLLDRDLT